MGGCFSGRWGNHRKATTAEECRVIDLAAVHDGSPTAGRAGVLRWHGRTGVAAEVGFAVVPTAAGGLALRLAYRWTPGRSEDGREVTLLVALERAALPQGGFRWWGRCPLAREGTPCRRRVGKLYLPPGSAYFGCRACHRLAYASSQRHDRRVDQLLRDPDALLRLARDPQAVPVTQLGLVLRALDELRRRDERWLRRFKKDVRAGET
jgi:hypothetical protein